MNPGSSESSTEKPQEDTVQTRTEPIVDQFGQTLRDFVTQVARCKHSGELEMETSNEVIKYYNPTGLGGAKYFIFEGIKVFPAGLGDEIKNAEEEQMGKRLHGSKEGVVL